jgi:signal transduction histidine kinase
MTKAAVPGENPSREIPRRRFFWTLFGRPLSLPPGDEGSLAFWRRQILESMLATGAILGSIAYIPSVLLSVRVHLWSIAVVDTLAYGYVLWAALSPRWSFRARVRGLLLVVYLLAVLLLVRLGTAAAGLLWLMAVPVLAAVLRGLRSAIFWWLLGAATLAACGWAVSAGLLDSQAQGVPQNLMVAAWVVNSSNALFLSAMLALPTALLLKGLDHTHHALSREQERFSKVFQSSPEPIAITRNSDGCILDVNEAWIRTFGWTREECLGGSDVGGMVAGAGLGAAGDCPPRALELRRRDGSLIPALVSARVLDLGGEACLLVAAQDLTATREAEAERQRLEAELLHAQKLESLGSLAGGVAHDMNNILAAIIGLGSTLQEQHQGNAGLSRSLGIILAAGERGRKLVRRLTDFARKGLEDARPVDLNALVRELADLLRSTTLQRIELILTLEPDLPPVLGERSALHSALMNLSVNAMDAMPEGGTLTFRTALAPRGEVELAVADTGVGMAPAVLARAMEPFFTTKPAGKGTGLGLAGVYGTMKAHGGSVEIRSREGQGTRIQLRFPVLGENASGAPAANGAEPEPRLLPRRVLVVDDDPIILETLPSTLEHLGNTVHKAARGQEALDLLEDGLEVDLVILDHNMPGLSGSDTLLRLRALRPDLPVILSTGFLAPEVEEEVRRVPALWLLNKPYTLPAIREKMAAIPVGGQG